MGRALTPGLLVSERVAIQRRRELPISGEILFEIGATVRSTDIVGRAELPGELIIARPAERMGIEVFEVLEGLKVQVGDRVTKGSVLCEHRGLFGLLRTRFPAPENAVVEFITERTGHIGLRLPSKELSIEAYIDGKVVSVVEGKAIVIEAEASVVQGIFGVGGERQGILEVLQVSSAKALTAADLPADCRGKVIVGGAHLSPETIPILKSRGAVGVVVGSIDDAVLSLLLGYELGIALTGDEDIPFTVIATEGFGMLALSERVLEILSAHQGARVSVNGATQVRAGAVRPEIIVHSATQGEKTGAQMEQQGLTVGQRVRCIRVPFFGERGEVIHLPVQEARLETGAYARVVTVRLDSGEEAVVPRANVEIMQS